MLYRPRRRPSTMKASIRRGAREVTVGVVDVSETGIRLTVPDGFAAGEAVTVVTPRMQLTGIVRWARDGKIGVVLDRKLGPSELVALSGMSWGM